MVTKLLRRVLGGEKFEGHYDYCDVFDGFFASEMKPSGKPCSEDCANHPGEKVLLGESGTIRWP